MSSETGMPDDHDLYSFEVFEVNPPPRKGVSEEKITGVCARYVWMQGLFLTNTRFFIIPS